MKLLGLLIILNSLALTGYWVTGDHPYKGWAFSICLVAVFAGAFFVLQERVTELTIKGVGKLKAAAKQASADANKISELKSRVEAQSATVDLIAKEAASTVDRLQNIACTTAKATLTDLMAANFFDGTTLKTRLDLHDRIIDSLREIGISEDNIKEANKMWSKGIGIIYHRGIRYALEGRTNPNQVNKKASPELRKAAKEFHKTMNFEQWQVPSPNDMEAFIEGKGFMNETVRELIDDYRYFLETGNIRRRSVFENL